jgi:hypothetical protein
MINFQTIDEQSSLVVMYVHQPVSVEWILSIDFLDFQTNEF